MVWSFIGWKSVRKDEKKYVMKTNLKLRHQMGNEDRSDKWLEGAKNNDQQCGSKTWHLEEI